MTNPFFKKRLAMHFEQIALVHHQAVSQTEKTNLQLFKKF